MSFVFDHEKLRAYQQAIGFIVWCEEILQRAPKKIAVYDQLDRASTSIALNIAEGNGKFSNKDRCRFFDISRSSELESAACLDVSGSKTAFPNARGRGWEKTATWNRFHAFVFCAWAIFLDTLRHPIRESVD